MRTTLTLDDDVAALLRKAMANGKVSLKQAVNQALRAGLTHASRPAQRRRRRTRTWDGGRALIDLTSTSDALAVAESEAHR